MSLVSSWRVTGSLAYHFFHIILIFIIQIWEFSSLALLCISFLNWCKLKVEVLAHIFQDNGCTPSYIFHFCNVTQMHCWFSVYSKILISTLKTLTDILDWHCVTSDTIYLFFRTYVIKFFSLTSLSIPP